VKYIYSKFAPAAVTQLHIFRALTEENVAKVVFGVVNLVSAQIKLVQLAFGCTIISPLTYLNKLDICNKDQHVFSSPFNTPGSTVCCRMDYFFHHDPGSRVLLNI